MVGLAEQFVENSSKIKRIGNTVIRVLELRNPPGVEFGDGKDRDGPANGCRQPPCSPPIYS
jgi:hypothetical protein